MANKRKSGEPQSSGKGPKKTKRDMKVMTLEEKGELIKKIKGGMSYAACGRHYGVNESTVRYIYKKEKEISASLASSIPHAAKRMHYIKDVILFKTEKALNYWIEDMNRRRIPISGDFIREKAKVLYETFRKNNSDSNGASGDNTGASGDNAGARGDNAGASGDNDDASGVRPKMHAFSASKGWFKNFKKRYSLNNVSITGESASVAAKAYPAEFAKIIEEKGYLPEQVFNADETGLWWKKMPARTYIAREEKSAPGFKVSKERVTVLLCGNAAGNMIKPLLLHTSKKPRALARQNMNLLPVYYQANKEAWMTKELFMDWFKNCFIPEVRKYLEKLNINFKVLLVLDNCPGHPDDLNEIDPNVQAVFLPKNTTSLIQPMDQGVIAVFKSKYSTRTFSMMRTAMNGGEEESMREMWRKHNIAGCIEFIKEAHDELSQHCVNSCWERVWPAAVKDFKGFPATEPDVKKMVLLAKAIGGESFKDMTAAEIESELLGDSGEGLTNEDLQEIIRVKEEEETEVTDNTQDEPQPFDLEFLYKQLRNIQDLTNRFVERDPSMERALIVKRQMEAAIKPYIELKNQLRQQQAHSKITMFFNKLTRPADQPKPPHPASPTSSDIDELDDSPPLSPGANVDEDDSQ